MDEDPDGDGATDLLLPVTDAGATIDSQDEEYHSATEESEDDVQQ